MSSTHPAEARYSSLSRNHTLLTARINAFEQRLVRPENPIPESLLSSPASNFLALRYRLHASAYENHTHLTVLPIRHDWKPHIRARKLATDARTQAHNIQYAFYSEGSLEHFRAAHTRETQPYYHTLVPFIRFLLAAQPIIEPDFHPADPSVAPRHPQRLAFPLIYPVHEAQPLIRLALDRPPTFPEPLDATEYRAYRRSLRWLTISLDEALTTLRGDVHRGDLTLFDPIRDAAPIFRVPLAPLDALPLSISFAAHELTPPVNDLLSSSLETSLERTLAMEMCPICNRTARTSHRRCATALYWAHRPGVNRKPPPLDAMSPASMHRHAHSTPGGHVRWRQTADLSPIGHGLTALIAKPRRVRKKPTIPASHKELSSGHRSLLLERPLTDRLDPFIAAAASEVTQHTDGLIRADLHEALLRLRILGKIPKPGARPHDPTFAYLPGYKFTETPLNTSSLYATLRDALAHLRFADGRWPFASVDNPVLPDGPLLFMAPSEAFAAYELDGTVVICNAGYWLPSPHVTRSRTEARQMRSPIILLEPDRASVRGLAGHAILRQLLHPGTLLASVKRWHALPINLTRRRKEEPLNQCPVCNRLCAPGPAHPECEKVIDTIRTANI